MWKPVAEMTVEECEREIDHLESYLRECSEIGQGWSTKDVVRLRLCRERVGAPECLTCSTRVEVAGDRCWACYDEHNARRGPFGGAS